MDAKFGMNVPNRMWLNAAKFQGYGLYRFWVIKGGKITPPSPRLGLIYNDNSFIDVLSQNEYDSWRYVNV